MRRTGFTLIELIVVIGIIAVLATVVIVAVNPARQLAKARNSQRKSDVQTIYKAINQYAADNLGGLPVGITTTPKTIGTTSGAEYINLSLTLAPTYVSLIPRDPQGGTDADTKYQVYINEAGRLVVIATIAELSETISVGGTTAQADPPQESSSPEPPSPEPSPAEYAVSLDGSDDHVLINNNSSLQLTSGTIEAWVKTGNAGSEYRGIIVKQWAFGLFLKDNVLVAYDWSSGERNVGVNLADNQWHHVAMTFQSGVSNGVRVYVDGVLSLTTQLTIASQTVGLSIGSGTFGAMQAFTGVIDEARVSNSLRYNANFTPQADLTADASTVGLWHFDEGSGTVAADAGSYDNDGTLTSGPTWTTGR